MRENKGKNRAIKFADEGPSQTTLFRAWVVTHLIPLSGATYLGRIPLLNAEAIKGRF